MMRNRYRRQTGRLFWHVRPEGSDRTCHWAHGTGIPDRIRTLPGVRYAITTNGAVVADLKEDRIISTCRIPVDTALRVLEMARDSGDDIMYDAYMDGIGCTTQYFYDHAERYAVSAGVAALIRKTRRVVPDNIRYVKEMGKEIDKDQHVFYGHGSQKEDACFPWADSGDPGDILDPQ